MLVLKKVTTSVWIKSGDYACLSLVSFLASLNTFSSWLEPGLLVLVFSGLSSLECKNNKLFFSQLEFLEGIILATAVYAMCFYYLADREVMGLFAFVITCRLFDKLAKLK